MGSFPVSQASVRVQAGPTNVQVFIDGDEVRAVVVDEVADQIASEREMDGMVARTSGAFGSR